MTMKNKRQTQGMHHLRSVSDVRRFRFSAILLLANRLSALIAAGGLLYAAVVGVQQAMIVGSGFLILAVLLVILQWITAYGVGCPLCRTPVLAPQACMKHRRARTFLGSHRLRVAMAILWTNRFRCPYCNEPSTMEVRDVHYRPVTRGSQPGVWRHGR